MGHIYRNNREIPIPPDGRVNRWDMKVSVYRQQDGRRRRTVIGAAKSETMMLPNDNFRIKHPDLRNEYYGADENSLSRFDVSITFGQGCRETTAQKRQRPLKAKLSGVCLTGERR